MIISLTHCEAVRTQNFVLLLNQEIKQTESQQYVILTLDFGTAAHHNVAQNDIVSV